MLDNYALDQFGTLYQIKQAPFVYSETYANIYNIKRSDRLDSMRTSFATSTYKTIFKIAPMSLLDMGFGNGDFLRKASEVFDQCFGYDIVKEQPMPDGCKRIDDPFKQYADVATFWDSLEHFPDPYGTIQRLRAKFVCVSAPYCHWKSHEDDEWLQNWRHLKPNEHLYHFTPQSLRRMMESLGYKCIVENAVFEDEVRIGPDDKQNIFSAAYKRL